MMNAQGNRRWAAVIVAAISMMLVAAIAVPAQTFTTLVNFNGANGADPYYSPLVQGTDGNLYGTTAYGGASNACANGCGTVFKLTPSGALTTLHNFDLSDGEYPISGLVLGTDGNFYGTTAGNDTAGFCGTVFKISPSGTLTNLHSFNCTDGNIPVGSLIQGTDGNFYGATAVGGAAAGGTVFKITPAGILTTLVSFTSVGSGGYQPEAGLIQATDGNFYGTTLQGGNHSAGTVFKMTPAGVLTTLYNFCSQTSCNDGDAPRSALAQGTDSNFYGTTSGDGPAGFGTVFKITPAGVLTTIHSFGGYPTDGAYPSAQLYQALDGRFYSTTQDGGTNCGDPGCGTIYKIAPDGTVTLLHSFDQTDGVYVYSGVTQSTSGRFYGAAYEGGTNSYGTVFGLLTRLGPFVKTVPTAGKTGRSLTILGTKLTDATSVTFNGTPATFTVESATAIKTTVPTGATTGPVQVVTPSGTLTSNVSFQVLP